MGDFSDRVFAVVKQIPYGKVSTYGQVARIMGRPQSARYVGFALRNNPEPATGESADPIPCHRVLFKDGSLVKNFAFGGPDEQRKLLEAEGVTFINDHQVDLVDCLWDGNAAADASPASGPTAPPADFDWAAELDEE